MTNFPTAVRNGPFDVLFPLQKQISQLMDSWDWGNGSGPRSSTEAWLPAMDLKETKDSFLVKMELPGLAAEDIRIDCAGDQLTIRGEVRKEEKRVDETWHRTELRRGAFLRTLSLPGFDADRIKAAFKNGILEVSLPKKDAEKGRTVKVEVGK